VPFVVTGGQVRIQMDDDGLFALVEIIELEISDIDDILCDTYYIEPYISWKAITFVSDEDYPLQVDHGLQEHNLGQIIGYATDPNDDDVQPVIVVGSLKSQEANDPPKLAPLGVAGQLPGFFVNITQQGDAGTLDFSGGALVLVTQDIPNAYNNHTLTASLRGLAGTLNLAP
jgi:hypothetical protein